MRRILITGGSGFIGFNLTKALLDEWPQCEIVVIDSSIAKSENHCLLKGYEPQITIHSLHIGLDTIEELSKILVGCELIIHLAALGNVTDSINEPLNNFSANVQSTIALLEAMRLAGIRNLIFSSTGGALMGDCPPPVNENSVPAPISPYGASKLACEGYIRAYSKSFGFCSIICRFGNVYGPYSLHKNGVVNKFIKNCLTGRPLQIRGEGLSTRDYIHVTDIARGLILCAKRILSGEVSVSPETYHLSCGQEVSLRDIASLLINIHGSSLTIEHVPEIRGEIKRNASVSLYASTVLGFEASVTFHEGLKGLYEWISKSEA